MFTFMIVLGVMAAITATVLTYIYVLPEKNYKGLNKYLKIVHNIFTFKDLFLEKIFQFCYILSTSLCVGIGFFMLFSFRKYEEYSYYLDRYRTSYEWSGGYGLLLLILGPVVIRIVYESLMMFILLVKNTIQINNKLKNCENKEAAEEIKKEAPSAVEEETPVETN